MVGLDRVVAPARDAHRRETRITRILPTDLDHLLLFLMCRALQPPAILDLHPVAAALPSTHRHQDSPKDISQYIVLLLSKVLCLIAPNNHRTISLPFLVPRHKVVRGPEAASRASTPTPLLLEL
jgi:hypothetical protein